MTVLWPIAVVTFKEGIRNKAIYGLTLFALLLFGTTALLATLIPMDVGKVTIDLALSTVSFSGLILVLFIGINVMAKDLDRRTIYSVLSRPISRSQYIFGKFFGMVLLICTAMSVLSLMALSLIFVLNLVFTSYFIHFSWPVVFLAIFFIIIMLILLSAVSFLFSSFTSSSFVTLILSIITYIIGSSMSGVKALIESSPKDLGFTISPVTSKMIQVAYYIFPNLSLFNIKLQAAHGISVPASFIAWSVMYGLVYIALTITLAALIFRKKEFP